MTRKTIRTIVRERLRDTGATRPRWSDETINRFIAEAERQAAIRARLLFDDGASSSTLINVVAGIAIYLLPRTFFEVTAVRRDEDASPLDIVREEQMYRSDSRWRTRTAGQATVAVIKSMPDERLQMILYPKPQDSDALRISGYREPMYDMDSDGATPEIAPRHHEGLAAWACYRCLSIRDPDGYDPVKAADHLAQFEREFGVLLSADVRRKQRERRDPTIAPRSF